MVESRYHGQNDGRGGGSETEIGHGNGFRRL